MFREWVIYLFEDGSQQHLLTQIIASIFIADKTNSYETHFSMLTENTDNLVGTNKSDTFNGTTATISGDGDTIIDQSSIDNDSLNLTAVTADIVAADFNTVSGIENVNVTTQTAAAFAMDAVDFTGVKNLTINRGDLANGQIDGTGTVTVTNVDASKIAKVTAGDQISAFTVIQATKARRDC